MIKAIYFDFGGVMTNGGRGTELIERFAQRLEIPEAVAAQLLEIAWKDYMAGAISEAELWLRIESVYGAPIPIEKRSIWNTWDIMQPSPEMTAFVTDLKQSGFIVGLLSNVIPNTAEQIKEHGGYKLFDPLVLSCEVGYSKPQDEIYQLALDRLPEVKAEEVLFIDDQERCLAPAQELGIQTVLARNTDQIVADVSNMIG